jgi:hypothetical protein
MQKILGVCTAALLAAVIIGSWTMSTKGKAPNAPAVAPASVDPFDLMRKAIELPVHIIEDAF